MQIRYTFPSLPQVDKFLGFSKEKREARQERRAEKKDIRMDNKRAKSADIQKNGSFFQQALTTAKGFFPQQPQMQIYDVSAQSTESGTIQAAPDNTMLIAGAVVVVVVIVLVFVFKKKA